MSTQRLLAIGTAIVVMAIVCVVVCVAGGHW